MRTAVVILNWNTKEYLELGIILEAVNQSALWLPITHMQNIFSPLPSAKILILL